jgi:hypothetical protein
MRSWSVATLAAACLGWAICAGMGAPQVAAAPQQQTADAAFLDNLVGDWDMVGDTRGRPTHYRVHAERILKGGWVQFHLADAAAPSQYEASIFFGSDEKQHDYVAHWLDLFGGPGARVTGSGSRTGQTLNLVFPYAEGAFRNAWTFDPRTRRWSVTIEAQEPDGSWSHFARYDISRR